MDWQSQTGKSLRRVVGDITTIPADAIANAANAALAGGGGVDGAIHRAGGPSIMRELDEIRAKMGGCPTGGPVVTGAGNLPAKYRFHAVGPISRGGKSGEPERLASCYRTCLQLAEDRELRSLSFPSISTGVYGYPKDQAAKIALHEITTHLNGNGKVQEVLLVLYDQKAYDIHARVLRTL